MRFSLLLLAGAALVAQPHRPVEEFQTSAGRVKITPIHHASMMIQAGGKVIQVDPWSQGNYEGIAAGRLDSDHRYSPGSSRPAAHRQTQQERNGSDRSGGRREDRHAGKGAA